MHQCWRLGQEIDNGIKGPPHHPSGHFAFNSRPNPQAVATGAPKAQLQVMAARESVVVNHQRPTASLPNEQLGHPVPGDVPGYGAATISRIVRTTGVRNIMETAMAIVQKHAIAFVGAEVFTTC